MTLAVVDHNRDNTTSGGDTACVTGAMTTTGASLGVAHAAYASLGGGTPALTDSKGNTWTGRTAITALTSKSRLWYVASPTVGSSHTVTLTDSNGSGYMELDAAFFSGTDTSPYETENGASSSGAISSIQPGSITPTDGYLVVSGYAANAGGTLGDASINSSMTITDQKNDEVNVNISGALAWKAHTTGAINPTWSYSGTSTSAASTIASFKAAAAANNYNQNVFAATAAAATVVRQAGKIVAASSSLAATIVRSCGKGIASASSAAASIVRSCAKPIAAVSQVGATVNRATGKPLAAATSPLASVVRSCGKIVDASASGIGGIARAIGKPVEAACSPLATVGAIKVILRSIEAACGVAASISRAISKPISASVLPPATIRRAIAKAVTASSSVAATIGRAFSGAVEHGRRLVSALRRRRSLNAAPRRRV